MRTARKTYYLFIIRLARMIATHSHFAFSMTGFPIIKSINFNDKYLTSWNRATLFSMRFFRFAQKHIE